MMIDSPDWVVIDRAAAALGVKPESRKKWRQRGVPHRWRIPIMRHTQGLIAPEQFEVLEKLARKMRAARSKRRRS